MLNEAFQVAKIKKKKNTPIFPKMTGEKINTIFTVRGGKKTNMKLRSHSETMSESPSA